MSLTTEAAALATRSGVKCSVTLLEIALDPAEAAELRDALASDVQGSALSRALAARGHTLPALAIQRHRRGDCRCR